MTGKFRWVSINDMSLGVQFRFDLFLHVLLPASKKKKSLDTSGLDLGLDL